MLQHPNMVCLLFGFVNHFSLICILATDRLAVSTVILSSKQSLVVLCRIPTLNNPMLSIHVHALSAQPLSGSLWGLGRSPSELRWFCTQEIADEPGEGLCGLAGTLTSQLLLSPTSRSP